MFEADAILDRNWSGASLTATALFELLILHRRFVAMVQFHVERKPTQLTARNSRSCVANSQNEVHDFQFGVFEREN